MKKVLIVILIWFVVESFFYATIWTNEKNTLSDCWMFTGIVALFQIVLTFAFCSLAQQIGD